MATLLLLVGCATSNELGSESNLNLFAWSQSDWHEAFALALCGTNDKAALARLDRVRARRDALEDWLVQIEGREAVNAAVQEVEEEEGSIRRICPREPDPYSAIGRMNVKVRELELRRRKAGRK